MSVFRMFQHLLPRARAWRITEDKPLRRLFEGLSGAGEEARAYTDDVYDDIRPETARDLNAWEKQFALPDASLTVQERRDRLSAAWKALGGQSPRYLQDTVRAAGFDVYLHEWWEDSEPDGLSAGCLTARNPNLVLRREYTRASLRYECGEPGLECGEAFIECGDGITPEGYPLVNKLLITENDYNYECGEPGIECGNPSIQAGEFSELITVRKNYILPLDQDKWRFLIYFGGPDFGEIAEIDHNRRDEFERLLLRICPAHLWIGVLARYV